MRNDALEEQTRLREELMQKNQSVEEEIRNQVQTIKEDTRTNLEAIKNDTSLSNEEKQIKAEQVMLDARNTLQTRIESARQTIIQNREGFQSQIQMIKENVKQKIETEREQLRTRLESIKDEQKKQIVEKIAEQIQNVNSNYIDRLNTVLNNLEEILRGISSRADKAELNGQNVTQVRTDITAAQGLIAEARAKIAAQLSLVYSITVTNESNLGTVVSEARNKLHTDLSVLKDEITKVRDAVKKAAQTLTAIPKVDDEIKVSD